MMLHNITKKITKRKNKIMKYVVILGDGMSDHDNADGLTPLKNANKPFIDSLCKVSEVGRCQTVPEGMSPGSDTANLSVMGFDPTKYYTGRSPLEAISMGIKLGDNDITYRVNLVTLSDDEKYEDKVMLDYSAGEIDTASAKALIEELMQYAPKGCELYPGVSYRHCMVKRNTQTGGKFVPPHDILDRKITEYLPKGSFSQEIIAFMKKSNEILSTSKNNKTKANSVWLWGEGSKPLLPNFQKEHCIKGAVISAVDLLKGIGIGSGMTSIDVDGATGNIHTNFEGKVEAAKKAFETHDYVYLHIEAPDECGHQGDFKNKTKSIEILDSRVTKPMFEYLQSKGDFKMLIIPDHATPVALRTHTSESVPYVLYDSTKPFASTVDHYDEDSSKNTGNFVDKGCNLLQKMLGNIK